MSDNLDRSALTWGVLEETCSSAAMGSEFVLFQIPVLLFWLVEGVAVEAKKEWRAVRE